MQPTEQAEADAKSALKNATRAHHDMVAQHYPEFSSVVDLLRGAVGNNTSRGRQLTNIRKLANQSVARSASNVVAVSPDAKKAA